jgi:hypothetical protein
MGETDFTYGNRNNWGKGGLIDDHKFEQWTDYQVGLMFGTKIGKNLGLYIEGEYTQMWGREIFNSSFGLNYTFN